MEIEDNVCIFLHIYFMENRELMGSAKDMIKK